MLGEGISHTVIAIVTLTGGFILMIISLVTGKPLTDGEMTLITVLMGAVSGWYFGTRSTLSGAQSAADAIRTYPPSQAPSVPELDGEHPA